MLTKSKVNEWHLPYLTMTHSYLQISSPAPPPLIKGKTSSYNGLNLSGPGQGENDTWERTFRVLSLWSARWNLYQIDFKMEAKGVTPIPAPTSTATSYWKTSSLTVPKGPSTAILPNERRQQMQEVSSRSSALIIPQKQAASPAGTCPLSIIMCSVTRLLLPKGIVFFLVKLHSILSL